MYFDDSNTFDWQGNSRAEAEALSPTLEDIRKHSFQTREQQQRAAMPTLLAMADGAKCWTRSTSTKFHTLNDGRKVIKVRVCNQDLDLATNKSRTFIWKSSALPSDAVITDHLYNVRLAHEGERGAARVAAVLDVLEGVAGEENEEELGEDLCAQVRLSQSLQARVKRKRLDEELKKRLLEEAEKKKVKEREVSTLYIFVSLDFSLFVFTS